MTIYHMKKDGTPGICNAEPGNCPLGGNENHVEASSLEQAQQQFDNKNEKAVGQLEFIKSQLDGELKSYSEDEQTVFLNMRRDTETGPTLVSFDDLPEGVKRRTALATDCSPEMLSGVDFIVQHRDLRSTQEDAASIGEDVDEYMDGQSDHGEEYTAIDIKALESYVLVDNDVVKQKKQEYAERNEHVDRINSHLRRDLSSYTEEEQAIFMNAEQENPDELWVNYDKLPQSTKDKITKQLGDNLNGESLLVIHRDTDNALSWALEGSDEPFPITELNEMLDDPNKYYADMKNLDDPTVSQEYKDKVNNYLDDYIEGPWDDCHKIPIDGDRGYLIYSHC